MPELLDTATGFRDLLKTPDEGGPYRYSKIFSDEGWRARRLSKRKFKLLKRIDSQLRPMLADGEQVIFLTQGTAVSFWESYFLGWVMYYVNRRAIALTNRRILLLQINGSGRPRELRDQIRYPAITRLKTTLLGNTQLRFRSGRAKLFAGVPRRDRAVLKSLIDGVSREFVGTDPDAKNIDHLCPHCFQPLKDLPAECPHCGGAFKTAQRAGVLSLLLPGLGDMYLGHRWLAVLEMLVALTVWGSVLAVAANPTVGVPETLFTAGFIFLIAHGLDAVGTWYIGKKGVHPASSPHAGRPSLIIGTATVGLVAVALLAMTLTKTGLQPADTAVQGSSLSAKQVSALRNAGYLGPDEDVLYFYSAGTGSILEDGNFFTDERIVSYALEGDSVFHEAAFHRDVIDLLVRYAESPAENSVVYVAVNDGRVFYLLASPRAGGDTAFATMLQDRWRTARVAAPTTEIWYDGGNGIGEGDAVLIRGAESEIAGRTAELRWLELWVGTSDTDWQLAERSHLRDGAREIDRLVVELPTGDQQAFYFDVTQSYSGSMRRTTR